MSNRTAPAPSRQRSRAKANARGGAGSYRRQTARLEGLRDGTPLIFGWGRHLTRAQKSRLQHLAAYTFLGVVVAAMLAVMVFGWVQQNLIIPNETIASVNSVNITQDQYRKQLAYDAQVLWNQLQQELQQESVVSAKAAKGDQAAATQDQVLIGNIQNDEDNYQQATITQTVIQEVVENQLIVQHEPALERQYHIATSKLEPSAAQLAKALASFKTSFPSGQSYAGFLSADHLSTSDVEAAIALHLRRQMAQAFLASTYTSPAEEVHLRMIEVNSAPQAQQVRNEIVKQHASWQTLAKQVSLDPGSKDAGGDLGYVARGSGDGAIEHWAFATMTKVGAISPVIRDTNGTFDVVQLLGIAKSRTISAATLQGDQQNALDHWLSWAKVNPANHLTAPNSGMLTASLNLPVQPNLNASLPNLNPAANGSATSGVPGASSLPTTVP